jgi:hypothetical protein
MKTKPDNPQADRAAHSQCIDALPALLSGALPPDDAARLVAHASVCADCAFEFELERRVAALLEPAHERAQFERLWARIVAADASRPRPHYASPRRWASSITALAATLLIGAGVAWYRGAASADYTTLADAPRHACGTLRVRVFDATPSARAALEASGARVVTGPDADGVYTLTAADPIEALRTLRASPSIRLAESTDC